MNVENFQRYANCGLKMRVAVEIRDEEALKLGGKKGEILNGGRVTVTLV